MSFITIKGIRYPYRQTMGALVRFKRMTGRESHELDDQDIEQVMTMVYCNVVSACAADGVGFESGFEEFCDCVDAQTIVDIQQEGKKKQGRSVR